MVMQCSYATAIGRDIYLVRLIAGASIKECKTNKVRSKQQPTLFLKSVLRPFFRPENSDILRFKKEIKLVSVHITLMVLYER